MRDAIGPWRLVDVASGAAMPAFDADDWLAVEVPGDTYQALIAAGRLADPYHGRQEAEAAWVREREWWWHAPLDLAESGGELVFEGLDTFAEVFVDGVPLGRADNMFRTWRFDLRDVAAGRHDLTVRFRPTAEVVAGEPLPVWDTFTDRISASRRTLMRKAQFGWGWDWGPDLPTVGVWRPVRVERRTGAVVRSVNFTTLAADASRAEVAVDVELTDAAEVAVSLLDPRGEEVASGSRHGSGAIALTVAEPQLWWTADLGAQPLYTLVARVAGAPEVTRSVGIRTIALDQSPDPGEPGTTFFRFVLNSVPVFAKGANWVPASSFVGAIPDETYRDLLTRSVEANMTTIRVWGGGIYEPDIFYDECDRLGLLVWQDFMFACAPYPDDDAFAENVRAEVAEQVARLRHHACLALWCGNNENQAIHWFHDQATGAETPLAGARLYDEVIPDILAELDPATPYWPGSPWGGPSPNSMRGGDVHDWTVWHGIPPVPDADPVGRFARSPEGVAYTRYAESRAKFVSEFGLQGSADLATLRRWMDPADLQLGELGFLERIKDVADKATAMMLPVTGAPATIEEFVDFTQFAQAEGLKFGIEHFRRRAPHCSGALIWQLNDSWPCVSWSLIDYDGVAKPSWYATRRAFAPVLASFRREGEVAELWVTNDRLEPVREVAALVVERFEGTLVAREEVAIDVPAQSSRVVWSGPIPAADAVLQVRGASFAANRLLPAMAKDLPLGRDAGLSAMREDERVTIRAERYALAVRLGSEDPQARFDDNHFDLAAGESRVVTVTGSTAPLSLRCWNDRARRITL